MLYNKVSLNNFFFDKVKVQLNVLSSGMLNKIAEREPCSSYYTRQPVA